MNKIILYIFTFLFLCVPAFAQDAIYTTEDGTQLKCTGVKIRGILEEYDEPVEDYYTFKKGKIYSRNMLNTFKDGNGKDRKVKKLKISSQKISFKERLYTWGASNYKFVKINRQTGKYFFKAKKQYNWAWYCRRAVVIGQCEIVK